MTDNLEGKYGTNLLIWDGKEPSEEEWMNLELGTPITHMKIHNQPVFQVHRCDADGGIVTEHQKSIGAHLGHKIKQPVMIKRNEVMALVDGVIPS